MKSTGTQRSAVKADNDRATANPTGGKSHGWVGSAVSKSDGDQLALAGYQQRAVPLRSRPRNQRVLRHRYQEHLLDQPALHTVAKAKMMSRFTRIQVLSIIKLATMDKLRETAGAGGPNDPTTAQQRLSTEGGAGGATVAGGGGGGGGGGGDGCSDEYHHQFYNTGRIGRRNALPDILGTHCTTTTADLSTQLGALSTSDCTGKAADASSIASGNNGQPPPTTTAT
ncbi:putative lysozyme-like protein [Anopheles maculipalpis]|uniref:putative lysozyme-like protein n=1 Tax=Anopheles maculipalpis TaxID=1496333 RepID=UPI0021595854|nr:putative lysozyme-like protein [Anopheles maculipalpis]